MDEVRYSRQIPFDKIGRTGQEKLAASRAAVIGVGALGTVIANNLCRSGVGFIRLVDRDYVEKSNLQRQTLFTEQDAAEKNLKAVSACEHLGKINSEIKLQPVIVDVNSSNIEELISDVDVVIDGTDNYEARCVINEACVEHRVPWIYGGALMSSGVTMNIIPGKTPCLRCLLSEAEILGSYPTCVSAGVLNMITGLIGCVESAEAVKLLIGSPDLRKTLMMADIWNNSTDYIEVIKNPDCPVCAHHRYEYLGNVPATYTTSLCGRDSIQVVPGMKAMIDLENTALRLKKAGTVKYNRYMLVFSDKKTEFDLFQDGRAIIKNVSNDNEAKSIYSEYIGI